MGTINIDNVREVFTYHQPDTMQIAAISAIREDAIRLATTILASAPDCADRSAAIRKVREAMMTANASIVLKGSV